MSRNKKKIEKKIVKKKILKKKIRFFQPKTPPGHPRVSTKLLAHSVQLFGQLLVTFIYTNVFFFIQIIRYFNLIWILQLMQFSPHVALLSFLRCSKLIRQHLKKSVNTLLDRVSIRKTFAQFLRNETQIFLLLRIIFARKNSNLRNHSQKSFRAKLPYSAFSQLIHQLELRSRERLGRGGCLASF